MFTFFKYVRGAILAAGLLISWLFTSFGIVIGGCFACLAIIPRWRRSLMMRLNTLAIMWAKQTHWLLLAGQRHKWQIQDASSLCRDQWYVLICNHQSWADILALNVAFGYHIPMFKYFLKRSLLWTLPVGGLACWVLDFPFVARHSREKIRKNPKLQQQNIEQIQQCCLSFRSSPATVINFVEGTRFTHEKHRRQKSPYKNLLKPKTQGIALAMQALHDKPCTVIDVTMQCKPRKIGLWQLLCGDYDAINIQFETINCDTVPRGNYFEDREFRKQIQAWLTERWQQKDKQMDLP